MRSKSLKCLAKKKKRMSFKVSNYIQEKEKLERGGDRQLKKEKTEMEKRQKQK